MVHIIELPSTLCRKIGEEDKTMNEFWNREVARVDYFKKRFEIREEEWKAEKNIKDKDGEVDETIKKKEEVNNF